jgi:L-serine/L-threonine ammonia-lyase
VDAPSLHLRTPLIHSTPLSRVLGRPVLLKLENTQPAASFKLRGIGRLCAGAAAAGSRLFVSSSGGNAGLAAAYAGRKLGVRTLVVVPRPTPAGMRALIEAEGAELLLEGDSWPQADERARALVAEEGGTYVSPFDHPEIWAGHSTIVDEVAEDVGQPAAFVFSVSGGGLLAGVLEGLRRRGWTGTQVVGAQAAGAATLSAALEAGAPASLARVETVARTLRASRLADGAFARLAGFDVRPWKVADGTALAACRRFLDDHRMLVEPSCGVALAAVYERAPAPAADGPVVVIVCGGAGITLDELEAERARLASAAPA